MRPMRGLVTLTALMALCWPELALAQASQALSAEELRAVFLEGLEQHKTMDLEFAAAIPDSALRWAPTPGVRDFAQQIEHIALDNVNFVARAVLGERPPSFGEPEVYLNDKAELGRLVEDTYDYVIDALSSVSAEGLMQKTELFGRQLPKWKVFLLALHHADWTRGQLVPYFRLNGVDPPEWRSY